MEAGPSNGRLIRAARVMAGRARPREAELTAEEAKALIGRAVLKKFEGAFHRGVIQRALRVDKELKFRVLYSDGGEAAKGGVGWGRVTGKGMRWS